MSRNTCRGIKLNVTIQQTDWYKDVSYTLLNFTHWDLKKNVQYFAYAIFKWILLKDFFIILIQIPLQCVYKGPLIQVMAWHLAHNKPITEPMMMQFIDAYVHHQASMS